jgi:hypothetical protein
VRVALVQAIAEANPAFICLAGDIVYNGYDANDWKTWDTQTSGPTRTSVYPTPGNHDLHGDEKIALGNYFQRFPDLKNAAGCGSRRVLPRSTWHQVVLNNFSALHYKFDPLKFSDIGQRIA